MSIFHEIKQKVSLAEVLAKDLKVSFTSLGDRNLVIEDERDHGGCPFCGHFECFRVMQPEESSDETSFYKCFSCGEIGDVITWRTKRHSSEDPVKPIRIVNELAEEFNVKLDCALSPLQQVFDLAADYYEGRFWEYSGFSESSEAPTKFTELGNKTPYEYQTEVRGHSKKALQYFHVGWSDGGCVDYLDSLGIDPDLIAQSGLKSKKATRRNKDHLPRNVFIYPHYVNNRVSHFTFKDPLKKIAYQLSKKNSLNGYMFYGQDLLNNSDTVVLVEGENDLISTYSTGKAPAVLATIGTLSRDQLDWLQHNCSGKRIITLFDPDDAGDKYRLALESIRPKFKDMVQILPPEQKDIDDLLREGRDLEDIVYKNIISRVKILDSATLAKDNLGKSHYKPGKISTPAVVAKVFDEERENEYGQSEEHEALGNGCLDDDCLARDSSNLSDSDCSMDADSEVSDRKIYEHDNIVQHQGCYWRIKYVDEKVVKTKISDFVIQLRNVYITDNGDREREILVIRQDGYTSRSIIIDDETRVSVKPFKVMMAKAAEASFMGKEDDMVSIWKIIYMQYSGREVRVSRVVGWHPEHKAWIFRNKLITHAGVTYDPDEEGIFWMEDKGSKIAIKPESLTDSGKNRKDIPEIVDTLSKTETRSLMDGFLRNLSLNINSRGTALLMAGWAYSQIHSDFIFDMNRGYPFLFLWGTHGKGKTTVGSWIQDILGMNSQGYTTVPMLRSGVGWARKSEYYSCLPLFIDEVRSNEETKQYLGTFRSYYDRAAQTMGTKESFGVRIREVRANFIFVGEDQFEDPANRERCIPVRIPKEGRELETSYRWMESNRGLFTAFAYDWILESGTMDKKVLRSEIQAIDKRLISAGCSARTSKNWAAVGYFAKRLADEYMPDFDFLDFLTQACTTEAVNQSSESTVMQLWDIMEGITAQTNPKITDAHIMREGDLVHIWYSAIYKEVVDASRGRFNFSKNAVLSAIKEEPYYHGQDRRVQMGIDGARRRVVTLKLESAPEPVKNMVGFK